MAKKSAKSKGYRKQAAKKPYLSRREIIALCAVVVAVAIGAFFLFRYDDGALKVQNGEVVLGGENWLVVNGSNTRGGARYYKLGEVGELDGYNRTAQTLATDANIPEYLFSPAGEGNQVGSITVTTSHNAPDALARYARTALESVEGTDMGALETVALEDGEATYYIYSAEREQGDVTNAFHAESEAAGENAEPDAADENAESDGQSLTKGGNASAEKDGNTSPEKGAEAPSVAEPLEANRFTKSLAGYFKASHDSCIVVHVNTNADSAEDCLSDEALVDILKGVRAVVTLEQGK